MDERWTVRRILEWIEGYLGEHGDADSKRAALWLVSDALGLSRIQLFADLDRPLSQQERAILREYTVRRAQGEPLQYITGTTDFRFITLDVRPGVLIPRPETEVLVSEALLALRKSYPWVDDTALPAPQLYVLDICTGSGNIALSIAHELSISQVVAIDLSSEACQLASENAVRLGLNHRVNVVQGDLGQGIPKDWLGNVGLLVSNPPYIPSAEVDTLDSEVKDYEPRLALDGGPDGLDVFRKLLPIALHALAVDGVLAVELHETTLEIARELALQQGFAQARIVRDLAGRPRVLIAVKH